MGLQHYTQDMSRIPLKYHTNVLFYKKYTHPTLICRGMDERTHGRTDGRRDGQKINIYSIFRDKLLLLGEHISTDAILIASVFEITLWATKTDNFLSLGLPLLVIAPYVGISMFLCSIPRPPHNEMK